VAAEQQVPETLHEERNLKPNPPETKEPHETRGPGKGRVRGNVIMKLFSGTSLLTSETLIAAHTCLLQIIVSEF